MFSSVYIYISAKQVHTVCPRRSDPFYIVSYFIKWVTTFSTYSIIQLYNFTRKNIRYVSKGCPDREEVLCPAIYSYKLKNIHNHKNAKTAKRDIKSTIAS